MQRSGGVSMPLTAAADAECGAPVDMLVPECKKIDWNQALDYLSSLEDRGCVGGTVDAYQRSLKKFFEFSVKRQAFFQCLIWKTKFINFTTVRQNFFSVIWFFKGAGCQKVKLYF